MGHWEESYQFLNIDSQVLQRAVCNLLTLLSWLYGMLSIRF